MDVLNPASAANARLAKVADLAREARRISAALGLPIEARTVPPTSTLDRQIPEMFAEWCDLQAQVDQPDAEHHMGVERYDAAIDRLSQLELAALDVPLKDTLSFVMVIFMATSRGVFDIQAGRGHRLWRDAEALIGGAA